MNTTYDEFDDVDRSHAPCIISAKARAAMGKLMKEHRLRRVENPGGAEFVSVDRGNGFRCQIHLVDDVEDLATLRRALNVG